MKFRHKENSATLQMKDGSLYLETTIFGAKVPEGWERDTRFTANIIFRKVKNGVEALGYLSSLWKVEASSIQIVKSQSAKFTENELALMYNGEFVEVQYDVDGSPKSVLLRVGFDQNHLSKIELPKVDNFSYFANNLFTSTVIEEMDAIGKIHSFEVEGNSIVVEYETYPVNAYVVEADSRFVNSPVGGKFWGYEVRLFTTKTEEWFLPDFDAAMEITEKVSQKMIQFVVMDVVNEVGSRAELINQNWLEDVSLVTGQGGDYWEADTLPVGVICVLELFNNKMFVKPREIKPGCFEVRCPDIAYEALTVNKWLRIKKVKEYLFQTNQNFKQLTLVTINANRNVVRSQLVR